MTEPRWLDEDEQRTWRAYVAAVALVERTLDRQLQRDSGMPHTYYMVLAMLSEAPGRQARMSWLADVTSSSPSRLSHAVARLEERGWVRRERDSTDRRGSVAGLTQAGWEALVAAAPGHVAQVRSTLFDPLTREQVGQLEQILSAVLSGPESDETAQECAPDDLVAT